MLQIKPKLISSVGHFKLASVRALGEIYNPAKNKTTVAVINMVPRAGQEKSKTKAAITKYKPTNSDATGKTEMKIDFKSFSMN